MVEGVGEDFWPGTFDPTSSTPWVKVADRTPSPPRDASPRRGIAGRWLRRDGRPRRPTVAEGRPDALVVVILPDWGRGYLSKVFDDGWMEEQGLEV